MDNYRSLGATLIFISLGVAFINTCMYFKDFFEGNANGAGPAIAFMFFVILGSFIVASTCAGQILRGSRGALSFFLLHVMISVSVSCMYAFRAKVPNGFYILKLVQLAFQVWAIGVVLRGQDREDEEENASGEGE